MARRKKITNAIKVDTIIKEPVENIAIENEEIKDMTPRISLNEYLSSHNRKKNLDNVIRKWYLIKDKTDPMKTKEEWDRIVEEFFGETEK